VGIPGSGAITGKPRPGAAVVAGPTGTVGWGAAVGAATYGVAGAAVSSPGNGEDSIGTPGSVSLVGIGAEDISTAGAIGAGFSAGTSSGATGAKDAAVSSRAAAIPATAKRTSTTKTTSDRLGASAVVDRSILTN